METSQQGSASGAIDSSQAGNDSAACEDKIFGVAKDLAGCCGSLGGSVFADGASVELPINGGAAGVENAAKNKGAQEIGRAIEIDVAVTFGVATAGADAVDDPIVGAVAFPNSAHPFEVANIDRGNAKVGRVFSFGRGS